MFLGMVEGPLDEKYAMIGAGVYFVGDVVRKIVATGFLQISKRIKIKAKGTFYHEVTVILEINLSLGS